LETLDFGQIEFFILFLAVVAAALLLAGRPFFAGIIAGILPWIKLPWVFLLLPLLLEQHRMRSGEGRGMGRPASGVSVLLLGYGVSALFLGALAPILVFGFTRWLNLTQDWVGVLSTQDPAIYSNDYNQGLFALGIRVVHYFGGTSFSTAIFIGGVLAVALGWLLLRRTDLFLETTGGSPSGLRRKMSSPQGLIAPWLIYNQLLNPLAWRWGSAFLVVLPFAFDLRLRKSRIAPFVGLGVLWLLQQNPVVQALGFQHWTDLHGYGLVGLYWIVSLLTLT